MLQEYGEYFESMLDGPPFDRFGPPRRFIRIGSDEFRLPPQWREDARYFLDLNVNLMVVTPYMLVNKIDPSQLRDTDLWRPLLDDFRLVTSSSEMVASRRGRDYVSATSVVMAMTEVADNLSTLSLRIWGPGG
jgi:hypothetical protein